MKMGNQQKIIIGAVAAVGVIAALHFVVFGPKAASFQAAYNGYTQAVNDLAAVGIPPAPQDVTDFKTKTVTFETQFYQMLLDANLDMPPDFKPTAPAPAAGGGAVDPLTGQPVGGGAVDPLTGQPIGGGIDPLTGQPLGGGLGGFPGGDPSLGGGLPGGLPGGLAGGRGPRGGQFDPNDPNSRPKKVYAPLTYVQKLGIWNQLHELEKLRDEPQGTRLTFMETPQQQGAQPEWNILRALPDSITRANVAVVDLVRQLENVDAVIKSGTQGSRLRYEKQVQYVGDMRNIGLDPTVRENLRPVPPALLSDPRGGISNLRGNLAAVIHTLNRIDLIKKSVTREQLNFASEEELDRHLMDLLRLEPEQAQYGKQDIPYLGLNFVAVDGLKQLEALAELIKVARAEEVAEVASVKLMEAVEIEQPAPPGAEASAVAGGVDPLTGQPLGGGEGGLGLGGIDPFAGGGAGFGAPARPKIATSVPIEMTIRGTNKAVMEYLYAITHNNKLWSVDALLIRATPNEADRLTATFVVHVISRFEDTRLQLSEQEINEKLATAKARATGGDGSMALADPATVVQ